MNQTSHTPWMQIFSASQNINKHLFVGIRNESSTLVYYEQSAFDCECFTKEQTGKVKLLNW